MIVTLNKSELTIETGGVINDLKTTDTELKNPKDCLRLSFEGFTGMNTDYVMPLLNLLCTCMEKGSDCYHVYKVTGNLHKDESIHTADFHDFSSVRDTQFLFKPFRNLGISLSCLRLGYEPASDTSPECIYVDGRVRRQLESSADNVKKELTLVLYCLLKFLNAVNALELPLARASDGKVMIPLPTLDYISTCYGTLPEQISVEVLSLNEDVEFNEVAYRKNTFLNFSKGTEYSGLRTKWLYNVFQTSTFKHICLINTTDSPMSFYRIDTKFGIVYTNKKLLEYNTLGPTEWLPQLINHLAAINKTKKQFVIKHLPIEEVLSTKDTEITITNDADDFADLMSHYIYASENTNLKIYDGFFKGAVVKQDSSTEDLAAYYAKDEYAQELFKQVQPYYDTFDLKDLTGIVKGIIKGDIYSALFEGESGTGKSTAARVLSHKAGIPFVAINCSTNIEESDILGTMIPNPTKKSADDPEFIWQDGPLTKAVRYGYVAIIEELGGARPGVLMKLNSLLDEARQLDLPNGEVIKAHANFRVIATTNIGYEGTNRLNKALVNRFEICKKFVELDEAEATKVIKSRTGYSNDANIRKVMDVYRSIKKYSNENNLGLVISIRQLLNLFRHGKYYKCAADAIKNELLNQAFLEEPEHLQAYIDATFSAFDLKFKI